MSSDIEKSVDGALSRELNEVRDDILACFEPGKKYRLYKIVNCYFGTPYIPGYDRGYLTKWLETLLFELEKESVVIHEKPEGRSEVFWMLATPEHEE